MSVLCLLLLTHKPAEVVTLSPQALAQFMWLTSAIILWWFVACVFAYYQRRLLLWLGVSVLGYPVSLVLVMIATPLGLVVTFAWWAALLVLPCYLMYRQVRYGRRRREQVVSGV